MCTVTFLARQDGYGLGMNRDEKLTRARGRPPTRTRISGSVVLCPSEPGGGTWISLNNLGACFALINWYTVTARAEQEPISRGEIVRCLSPLALPALAHERLTTLDLPRFNPFRLIGIFPSTAEVFEWRWNRERLTRRKCPWKTQQWISSGFDELTAQRVRGRTFQASLPSCASPGTAWLRKLHSSHSPERGPFSTCVHRPDAATVSYTEIVVNARAATMRYSNGAPCGTLNLKESSLSEYKIARTASPD